MFIDQKPPVNEQYDEPQSYTMAIIIFAAIVGVAIIGGLLYWVSTYKPMTKTPEATNKSTSTSAGLPDSATSDSKGQGGKATSSANSAAENIFFADFYKLPSLDFDMSANEYTLPVNVKTDTTNYFEVSRKINLDSVINDFNQNGFAVVDNPFGEKITNFYKAYDELRKRQVPILVTSDLLLYYYQNTLKDAYKSIEETSFYNDLWVISNNLFNIANNRYKARYEKSASNTEADLLLEAERQEAAYFAVAIKLLTPKKEQASPDNFSDTKFNLSETEKYRFELPLYLETDVNREIELITAGQKVNKSPVMLYYRDYRDFYIPREYRSNAKLNNFYLASRWYNSVFPLYFREGKCDKCLLDKDDWSVNFMTANLIAKDFANNQDIKNNWAKIYKLKSFFEGLRSGLTYLYYDKSAKELYGEDYNLDQIFSASQYATTTVELQKKLSTYDFAGIEGGKDKTDLTIVPYLGMQFLSESFWPNDYIFKNLIAPYVLTSFIGKFDSPIFTYCFNNKVSFRCRGFGMDIINLVNPLDGINKYFSDNTNFENYATQIEKLRQELALFNDNAWHSSNFWSYLNTAKISLSDYSKYPPYMRTVKWKERDVLGFLGGWINLQLPVEKSIMREDPVSSAAITDFDYVEPNLALINSLQADTKMLEQMFLALNVAKEKDIAYLKLEKLYNDLGNMRDIIIKQTKNEQLTAKDRVYINNIIDQEILSENDRTITLTFQPDKNKRISLNSIKGFKLKAIVYNKGGKKYIAFGPAFNYQEKAR